MLKSLRARLRRLVGTSDEISLYHWSPNDHRGAQNLGDFLSRIIVKGVLQELEIESTSLRIDDGADLDERRLLAIGSILHHAREGDIVWGAGINGKDLHRRLRLKDLDIRMVRGPLTQRCLEREDISCPSEYGEPGLLLSRYYTPTATPGKWDYVTVPNLNDLGLWACAGETVVDPTGDWKAAVDMICSSSLVISSSLHGLVVAESYGIPARHLLSLAEPTFKYRDYYEGTGRDRVEFAQTIEEALELGGVRPPEYDPSTMLDLFPVDVVRR